MKVTNSTVLDLDSENSHLDYSGLAASGSVFQEEMRINDQTRNKRLSSIQLFLLRSVPAVIFFLAVLPFGSVHSIPESVLILLTSSFAIWLLIRTAIYKKDVFDLPTTAQDQFNYPFNLFLSSFICLLLFCLFQSLLIKPHPDNPLTDLLNSNLLPIFLSDFLPAACLFISGAVISLLFFKALFNYYIYHKRQSTSDGLNELSLLATRTFLLISAVISLIALGHWFTDNGRLFGIYESVDTFVSNRARWPLVNPNHLGFMLLPALFFAATEVIISSKRLRLVISQLLDRISRDKAHRYSNMPELFARLLSANSAQISLGYLVVSLVFLFIIAAALIATMSRAVWFTAFLGTSFICLHYLFSSKHEEHSLVRSSSTKVPMRYDHSDIINKRKSSSRVVKKSNRRSTNIQNKKYKYPLIPFLSITLLIFSLLILMFGLGAGQELISDRLAYGLLYTHDNMRWQFYKDSWPMLSFFGIGVSQWKELYPSYMSEGLAGYRLDYLHSDTMQFIIEYGVIGSLLLATTFFILVRHLYLHMISHPNQKTAAALLIFFVLSLVPISFDFALRVPANLLLYGMLTGLAFSLPFERAEN